MSVADGEDQVAWRSNTRHVARLSRESSELRLGTVSSCEPDATYLVTGGFGGLGLVVGRWLVERGARHVALLGRHPDMSLPGVRAIEATGARVIGLAGDVADPERMREVFEMLASGEVPPLRGIVHAAADLSTAPIEALTSEQLSSMFRPKLRGTLLLEQLSRGLELDFLVLFSSTTALLGAAGLAHYAAANVFLDTFAHLTGRDSRRVLSVNWGTWEVMRLASEQSQREYREGGILPMPSSDALQALGYLLSSHEPQAVVASFDWSVLKPLLEARRARAFLARLDVSARSASDVVTMLGKTASDLPQRLAGAPPAMRQELLVEFVLAQVSAVLGIEDASVPLDTGLFDLGMDSLMSVELRKRLEQGVGRPLPSTLTFNYPSVNALVGFLDREFEQEPNAVSSEAPKSAATDAARTQAEAAPERVEQQVDDLSDADVEARLRARLERLR